MKKLTVIICCIAFFSCKKETMLQQEAKTQSVYLRVVSVGQVDSVYSPVMKVIVTKSNQ